MLVRTVKFLASLCALCLWLIARPALPNEDSPKAAEYRVDVQFERIDSLHVEFVVDLVNPGPIAALTLPLRWGNGRSVYRLDSADYRGLRTEYFALKTFRVDSTRQNVLIGLISDLGGNYPPLEAGAGGIARLHFSSKRPTSTQLSLDTTFIPPHNTLQLVTPDVRAIRPAFHTADSAKPQN